jgi:hypothetical protein
MPSPARSTPCVGRGQHLDAEIRIIHFRPRADSSHGLSRRKLAELLFRSDNTIPICQSLLTDLPTSFTDASVMPGSKGSGKRKEDMTRNLKVLGLALVAVLALAATMASSASATNKYFHSNADSTSLTGEQTNVHVFKTTAGELTCEKAHFKGSQVGKTSQEVTINTIEYINCHIIIFGSTVAMTVKTNECDYRFTAQKTNGVNIEAETVHLICPAGKKIQISGAGCTVEVGEQTLSKVSYSNVGEMVDVNADVANIVYNHSGFTCGTGSGNNGTYKGNVTVTSTDTAGNPTKTWYE